MYILITNIILMNVLSVFELYTISFSGRVRNQPDKSFKSETATHGKPSTKQNMKKQAYGQLEMETTTLFPTNKKDLE